MTVIEDAASDKMKLWESSRATNSSEFEWHRIIRSGNGEYCLPLPCTAGLRVTHNVHRRTEENAVGRGKRERARATKCVSDVTRRILADKNGTHLTPLPLNSSAEATPRARMRRRLKVAAALIPGGNPVEFLVSLNLPSFHQYTHTLYRSH